MNTGFLRGSISGFLVVFLGLMLGCAVVPFISQTDLLDLDKGMSVAQVEKRFASPPLSSKAVSENGRSFLFQFYNKITGNERHSYYLAYENSELLYWGYVAEFRRLSDDVLIDALDKARPYLKVPAKFEPKY